MQKIQMVRGMVQVGAVVAMLVAASAANAVTNAAITKTTYAPTGTGDAIGNYFSPSAVDLVNAGQPSLAGVSFAVPPASAAAINDGGIGLDGVYTGWNPVLSGYMGLANNTVTFTFADPYIRKITRIDGYSGDSEHVSAGRQAYNVYYSPIGDPAFYPIVDESFVVDTNGTPSNYGDDIVHPMLIANYYSQTTLTSLAGAGQPLAEYVDALQFVFCPGLMVDDLGRGYVGNLNNYWREIDVFGTVPEPATLTVAALGLAALAQRRPRR